MNRRDFIKHTLTILSIVLAVGASTRFCSAGNKEQIAHWAFFSDTHIAADVNDNYRGFYPYRNLQKVVSEILSDLPDAVVVAGDLARLEGKLDDYANLKELLAPLAEKVPVYMALGNHDDRDNFMRAFPDLPGEKPPVADKHITIIHTPPVRVILLDSLFYVNKVPGLLGKAQRDWLQDYLNKCDDKPIILCVHHTLQDRDGDLLDVPRLFEIIKPIRKVKAILYGHSHEYAFGQYEGIHLINIPATSYSFADKIPVGWVEAHLTTQGGEFILHVISGNTTMHGSVKKLKWRK
jgi:Icc protein